jgi:hypothetical protein
MVGMNRLVSINQKFMELPPNELIELIDKYTDGIEAYIDYNEPSEMSYLDTLMPLLFERGLHFQIHGMSDLPLDKQEDYLAHVSQFRTANEKVSVTFHPVYREDKAESVAETIDYLREIIAFTKDKMPQYEILLENLNDWDGMHRLKLYEERDIVSQLPELALTYDIGHVVADGATDAMKDVIAPVDGFRRLIKNLHIHTCEDAVVDHQPIYAGDKNWETIIGSLSGLSDIPTVVFEYDLLVCKGETTREKIIDYLETIAPVMNAAKLVLG